MSPQESSSVYSVRVYVPAHLASVITPGLSESIKTVREWFSKATGLTFNESLTVTELKEESVIPAIETIAHTLCDRYPTTMPVLSDPAADEAQRLMAAEVLFVREGPKSKEGTQWGSEVLTIDRLSSRKELIASGALVDENDPEDGRASVATRSDVSGYVPKGWVEWKDPKVQTVDIEKDRAGK